MAHSGAVSVPTYTGGVGWLILGLLVSLHTGGVGWLILRLLVSLHMLVLTIRMVV